jgi:uncharacterized protein (TIGR00297 family)
MYSPAISFLVFSILLFAAGYLAFRFRKLSAMGAVTGWITGLVIYAGSGLTGIALLASFFLMGVFATRWKSTEKQQPGVAENEHGRRGAGQVLANSSIAALIAILGLMLNKQIFPAALMIACCFSSATADTVSSELGTVYGKRFYNILTFRRDLRGLDGIISLEGTLAGLAGSILISLVYCMFDPWFPAIFIIISAGTIGNFTDSVLGAALERKGIIKNDAVNFLNTLVAALTGLFLYFLM